jgi:hypothetical protein
MDAGLAALAEAASPFFLSTEITMREWVLAEQNHAGVRSQRWEVAVLPFGATEPHNLHMLNRFAL